MSKPLDPEHPGRFSSSLVAGLAMLSCFTAECPVRGIADMAEALDLGRSTTHRYATTLVTLGYLEQGPSRKYRLAPRVSDVALSLFDSMVIRQVAREHLRVLRDQTGRTVSLSVLVGVEVVCIDRWHGSRRGQYGADMSVGLGTHQPVHCTAAGKAVLAHLPAEEQRARIVELRLGRSTPNTIMNKTALRGELEQIAADSGVAVEDEELLAGRRALAAAVVDKEDRPIAAVQVVVPVEAYTRNELVEQLGSKVAATAQRIASALVEPSAGAGG